MHLGAVQVIHQNIAVHRGEQVLPPLPPDQQLPQLGGGHIDQAGQGDGHHVGVVLPGQKLPLGGKDRLPVLLGAAEGADLGQPQDGLGVVPQVEGQKHVRPHEQPQFRLGVAAAQLLQRLGGVALALPLQLQGGHLHHAGQVHGVG